MQKRNTSLLVRALQIVILTAALLTTTGCLSTPPADDDQSPLPWNSPASWEGKTMGLPY